MRIQTTTETNMLTRNGNRPRVFVSVVVLLLAFVSPLRGTAQTDIVMPSHSCDTVWITPGECYTVYDPGGTGDYYSNDTSTLVIRSTSGLGFRLHGRAEVCDSISFKSDGSEAQSLWGDVDNYFPDGIAHITLITDEDSNSSGFVFHITFNPTIHALDTLWMTDTSMAITWQDTSIVTRWTITYGVNYDSLRTIATTTNQATLTGLERNAQCYLQIENNFGSADCFVPSRYGIRMPHDPDTLIVQYHNTYLENTGIHSLVEIHDDSLPLAACPHILHPGGRYTPFPDCTTDHDFYTTNGHGIAVMGNYNLGTSSKFHTNTGTIATDYTGADSTSIWSGTGYLCVIYSSDSAGNGTGFDLAIRITPSIYQVTASAVTCSTATLTWADTSDATTWWIAYGNEEQHLDTVSTTTRACSLSGLVPDRQYVYYLWSNEALPSCNAPIKGSFFTPCDTSIIIMPYNGEASRMLYLNECYTLLDPGGINNYHLHSNQTLHLHSELGVPLVLRGNAHVHSDDYLTIFDEGVWIWYYLNWNGNEDSIVIHSTTGNIGILFQSNGDTLTDSGFEFQVFYQTIDNFRANRMADSTYQISWDDSSPATQWTLMYGTDSLQMDTLITSTTVVYLHDLIDCARYYVCIANNAGECFDTASFQFCVNAPGCASFDIDMDTLYCTSDTIQFNISGIDSIVIYCPNGLVLNTPPYIIPDADSTMSGTYIVQGFSTEECAFTLTDSIRLYVLKARQFDIYDTIVENQLPWSLFDTLFYAETDTVILQSHAPLSCDSIYNYHLRIHYNVEDTVYYYACEDMLPVPYDTALLYEEGLYTFILTGSHGEDSIVTFVLRIIPSSDTSFTDTILENQLPWLFLDSLFTSDNFSASSDSLQATFHLVNEQGCDSTIHYSLFIFWNGDHCDTTLTFPSVVTPNGDGMNDKFVIGGLLENNCFRFNELLIYDRTGYLVYRGHNIAKEDDWWDPAARRNPVGTYFYIFKAHGVTIKTLHQGVIEVVK